jgi:tellurite resistance protein TehA-like permease
MDAAANDRQDVRSEATARWRGRAWILILIADAGFLAWGAMAAALPDFLAGPGGTPILIAGYEGFTRESWSELTIKAPMTASYIAVVFRLYGVFCLIFGMMAMAITVTAFRRGERWAWWALLAGNTAAYVSAMTYDQIVNAIGPFELIEYLGLAVIYFALAISAPFGFARNSSAASRPVLGAKEES